MLRQFALVFALSSIVLAQTPNKPAAAVKAASMVSPASDGAARLPVKRVVLYKNGVGYFEHAGRVHGSQDLHIDFTSAQLNDVLKSLTVVDRGEGRITGVRYDSIAPLSERMRTLRIPLGQQTSTAEFLNALRGAKVEVRSGSASVTGSLLSIETKARQIGNSSATENLTELSVVSSEGELRTFTLGAGVSVRLLDRELNQDVSRYLGLVSSSRSKDLRRMVVSTSGTGDREVFVSYISEVPVWKSTYRLILPTKEGQKPLLQGWAIVDNTVGEDWNDVQLSLVAGAPQSFVQDISQPMYVRRPEVALPQSAQLTPQTQEATMDQSSFQMDGGMQTYAQLQKAPPPPPPPRQAPTSSPSFGMRVGGARQEIVVQATGAELETMNSTVGTTIEQSEVQNVPAAEGREMGDLFSYDLKDRITIGKDQSALVPILQSRVEAEKVTLWSANSTQPLRAIWLKNTSGLTLDAGTFNIVEDGAFGGEGIIREIKPDERRLISYAADTAVRVKSVSGAPDSAAVADTSSDDGSDGIHTPAGPATAVPSEKITRVRIVRGSLLIVKEERQQTLYTVHNADKSARQVIIEHPLRSNWKLADGLKAEETSSSFYRFRLPVPPSDTQKLRVEEWRPLQYSYELNNLNTDLVDLWLNQRVIHPEQEKSFRDLVAKRMEIGDIDTQLNAQQQEVQRITADQSRLRENMKALKGTAEEKALTTRYTKELNDQEDRLADLQKQGNDLRTRRNKAEEELTAMAMAMKMD